MITNIFNYDLRKFYVSMEQIITTIEATVGSAEQVQF